jgi:uncharacterized protein
MFTKYWQPGAAKTRLARSVGASPAAAISFHFFQTLTERFSQAGDCRCVLVAPPDACPLVAPYCGNDWSCTAQAAGDLGHRLRTHFDAVLSDPQARLLAIGSDSPTLPLVYLQQAWQMLEHVDVVLGPSADGGYYLVGAARRVPPIFDNMDWSTSRVWAQTTQRLRDRRIPFESLPEWFDVDDLDGLHRLAKQLESSDFQSPLWRTLRKAVQQCLPP